MAPQFNDADLPILISCIKNSATKLTPNFDEVAKECGLKDSKAAYFRHWHMMKKLGLTGTRPRTQSATPKKEAQAAGASVKAGKKRAAAAVKEEPEAEDGDVDGDGNEEGCDDGNGEEQGSPAEPDTPTKKVKREEEEA